MNSLSTLPRGSVSLLLVLSALLAGPAWAAPAAASPSSEAPSDATATGHNAGSSVMLRNRMPPEQLEQQAADQYQILLNAASKEKRLLPDKNKSVQRVRLIANKLIPYGLKWNEQSRQWHWEINVIDGRAINALCLPGGKLVVTTGMLERMHLTDNELAMLLGHEIAHALREHARDRPASSAAPLTPRAVAQLFGLNNLGHPPPAATPLLAATYTRDDETEADVMGTEIAARAGYDPRAAVSLWIKFDGVNRLARQAYVQAHPFDARRLVDLQKHMRDMLALYARALGKPLGQLPAFQGVGYAASARRVAEQDNAD